MTTQPTTDTTTAEPEPETVTPSENRVIIRRESDGYEVDIPAAALGEERFAGMEIVSRSDGSPYEAAAPAAATTAPAETPPPPPPPPPAPAGDAD